MPELKLRYILRTVSILIILSLVFLFSILQNHKKYDIEANGDKKYRIKYKHHINSIYSNNPEFTSSLESLFPHKLISKIKDPVIIKEQVKKVDIPDLKFVGMIETNKRTIYSFRNRATNRLLLLEEGSVISGLTLLAIDEVNNGSVFIIKKQNITFQVDKK